MTQHIKYKLNGLSGGVLGSVVRPQDTPEVEEKVYNTAIRLAMVYSTKCRATKNLHAR